MTTPVQQPILARVPNEYDPVWFGQLLNELDIYFKRVNTDGPIRATTLTLTDLPTASAGLSSGEVWNDSGTLKVV